jgi:hypothetical protein
LAEYRLDDLARMSGVSARNIRAYRELGIAAVAHQLDNGLQGHMVSAVSDYAAGTVVWWKPTAY